MKSGVCIQLVFVVQGKGGSSVKEKEEHHQKLWGFIVKKEIPKMAKLFSTSRHNTMINNKKVLTS